MSEPLTFTVGNAKRRGACTEGLGRLASVLGYEDVDTMLATHEEPVPVTLVVDDDAMESEDDVWYACWYATGSSTKASDIEGKSFDLTWRRWGFDNVYTGNAGRYRRACLRMLVGGRINP